MVFSFFWQGKQGKTIMVQQQKPNLASHSAANHEFDFGYELLLVSHLAVSFYKKNCDRFNDVTLSEYVSNALSLIAGFGDGMDATEPDKAELLKLRAASKAAKDDILQARGVAEDKIGSARVTKLKGGFWYYYEQVITCMGMKINVVNSEHKITRPTMGIYDHYISINFSKDDNEWLYKVVIKDHKYIFIEGFVNGYTLPKQNLSTANGCVYFLLENIARKIALGKALKYVEFMKTESAAAKRAKAISKLLKGDFKTNKKPKRAFDNLEILE